MKAKKYWILLTVVVVFCAIMFSAKAVTEEEELDALAKMRHRRSLAGLEGVNVYVQSLSPDVRKYGLTREKLQTEAELLLRNYGIKVLTLDECLKTPGQPCLDILVYNTQTIAGDVPILAIAVHIALVQEVFLVRKQTTKLPCVTWNRVIMAAGSTSSAKEGTCRIVEDIVKIFCNDYLAANPKESVVEKRRVFPGSTENPKEKQ